MKLRNVKLTVVKRTKKDLMGKSEQDIQNNIFIAPLSSIYPLLLLFGTVKHCPNLSSEFKKI